LNSLSEIELFGIPVEVGWKERGAAVITVGIVGASGYTGGEAIRILLRHPEVQIVQATSESNAGHFVYTIHPNLRKQCQLKFIPIAQLQPCDVLFLCLPHGSAMRRIGQLEPLARLIIDLSADFRLRKPEDYVTWYGHAHESPDYLGRFVYGIPELHRETIKTSRFLTGAGCLATASILGLRPLFLHDVVARREVIVEAKVGSSAAGDTPSLSTHHPERSGSMRSFQATGHRHTAEILQEVGLGRPLEVHFSATAIEAVRGILATCHVFLKDGVEEKDIWKVYRAEYGDEPFIRIVKDRQGIYRYPEPKILTGTNYCDIGFEKDPRGPRLVVMSALDNLTKGAAGNGVQAMNLACGLPETTGLDFPGLHPI
jgi:N-acetyl-gamma-glutamyl-phosphate/LysW-gamma-L-alpha-aminoadipyl-6-phosphate reductase